MKVYFYPHAYLRDRQLDTIRRWPRAQIINPELAENRRGAQVEKSIIVKRKSMVSWKNRFPLLNIKRRPANAPKDAVTYIWGGLIASGNFIVELDNPWSLTGYNLSAMNLYKTLIRFILMSERCVQIRCMSNACRESLKALFGESVYSKARVHYPCIKPEVTQVNQLGDSCKFLFIGTQFEIKGGGALLKSFRNVYEMAPNAHLDVITHLPKEFMSMVDGCPGIQIHEANFLREQVHERFMKTADVLVLPTYVDSFGMVALEALAHGLAVIATDVYALRELVENGKNGELLQPPLSIWNEFLPSKYYYQLAEINKHILNTDTSDFEKRLTEAMLKMAQDKEWRLSARKASVQLMEERFKC